MSVGIIKLLKDDLSVIAEKELTIPNNAYALVISHYVGAYKTSENEIPFVITGTSNFVPLMNEVGFCVSVRKKVDFMASGVNQKIIRDNGRDVGNSNVNSVPSVSPELPIGFQEVYRSM